MEKKYILVLVHVDRYKNDLGGNKFDKVGDIVVAKEFSKDIDISKGLYGVPWGFTHDFRYDNINHGYWVVVKIEQNANIIIIDSFYNIAKFRNGIILHIGTLKSAGNFIIKTKKDKTHGFIKSVIPEEKVAGHTKWMQKYNKEIKNYENMLSY